MVAVNHNVPVALVGELLDALRDFAHRQQPGAADPRRLEFALFATIE